MSDLSIGKGMVVTMHFSLKLEDGSMIDSNFDADPATFTFGDGKLLPGFESVLLGLKVGDSKEVLILPEVGFGMPNPDNRQKIARDQFPTDSPLEKGLMFSFSDANTHERPGVVLDFDDENVTVDFNHPLAGRSIVFNVEIVNISPAVTH